MRYNLTIIDIISYYCNIRDINDVNENRTGECSDVVRRHGVSYSDQELKESPEILSSIGSFRVRVVGKSNRC